MKSGESANSVKYRVRGRRLRTFAFLGFALVAVSGGALFWGCGAMMFLPSLSVTHDGQGDVASARSTIESGGVPSPNSITVEGFMSEHAIATEKPANAGLVYAWTSVAWNRDFDAFTPLATIQIGFGATIDRATFHRAKLNLGLVIDRSGSMGDFIDQRSETTKLDAVKIAVDRLLAQLTKDDRVSIVTFNTEPQTRLQAVAGNDIAAIKTALDEVTAEGGTDLAAGVRRGFEIVAANADPSAGRSDRVIVFTDAQLLWRTEDRAQRFLAVMRDYANDDIGATVFGVGTDFGQEVVYDITQLRGGNYVFLGDYERIVTVFDDEFDFLVTPAASDVTLNISVPFVFDVAGVYGLPAEEPFGHTLRLTVPTLFLSEREGGRTVFVRTRAGAQVDFQKANSVAMVKLTYTTNEGVQETQPTKTVVLPSGLDPDGEPGYFESPATKRGVLLLNTALTLRSACEDAYNGGFFLFNTEGRSRAITRLTEFLIYFDGLAAGLEDQVAPESRSLSQERALVAKLLSNLKGGL